MRKINTVIFLIISFAFSGGCKTTFQKNDKNNIETINDIVAVYWHEGTVYSFAVENKEGYITMRILSPICGPVKIFRDVPLEKQMFAEAVKSNSIMDCSRGYGSLDIHIHNIQEINGAGWDHGKFGTGRTNIIIEKQ